MPIVESYSKSLSSYRSFLRSELKPNPIVYGAYTSLINCFARNEKYIVNPGTLLVGDALFEIYHLEPEEYDRFFQEDRDDLIELILAKTMDNWRGRRQEAGVLGLAELKPKSINTQSKLNKILRYLEKDYPVTKEFLDCVIEKSSAYLDADASSTRDTCVVSWIYKR
ncbi:MAG TPA: hypothetical protein VD770_01105 [Coxiellaceae bacterium]|nr:hypothetical protein [Coxiellaceae bacterium]